MHSFNDILRKCYFNNKSNVILSQEASTLLEIEFEGINSRDC